MSRLWNFVFACVDLVNAAASVVTLGFYWPDLDMKIRFWHSIRKCNQGNFERRDRQHRSIESEG